MCYLCSIMILGASIVYLGSIMIMGAYFRVRYTICYRLSSIMLMVVYCLGMEQIMLPWYYYDNGSILSR